MPVRFERDRAPLTITAAGGTPGASTGDGFSWLAWTHSRIGRPYQSQPRLAKNSAQTMAASVFPKTNSPKR